MVIIYDSLLHFDTSLMTQFVLLMVKKDVWISWSERSKPLLDYWDKNISFIQ